MYALNKKCGYCKSYIEIQRDKFVCEKDKYFHFDCFIKNKLELQKTKKSKQTREQIELYAKELQDKHNINLKDTIEKEQFIRWLQGIYNIVVIPKYIIDKIDSVLDGTYKGLSTCIPIQDLKDMWKVKKSDFDKLANYKKTKNEEIDDVTRIAYDLAILVNKYNGYLQWKEKQKLIEQEYTQIAKDMTEEKIDFKLINNVVTAKSEENINEISDYLDELF